MISLGEELRREREFREISLREISDATKINMRILEAIEKDDYKILPGGIFNRNFIRAYAQFIGIDPEIAVRKYEVQTAESSEEKPPASLMFQPEYVRNANDRRLLLIAGAVVLLILMALVWFFRLRIFSTFGVSGEILMMQSQLGLS